VKLRIGIDVGGTFTDLTAFDEDRGELVAIRKYLSDPAKPLAVMERIAHELATEFGADAVSLILHGSTVGLNTLLEDKGARVGLLTTAGFRDVYEIGRQWRGDAVFDFFAPAPRMLTTRDRIHEVRERVDWEGAVLEPLDEADVTAAVRALLAEGVEAVAVAFLFAYANPAHERAAARVVAALAPDLYLSLSSEVNPEWREYERTASTVANAFIGPPVSRYLRELEALAAERHRRARVLAMKSDGGAAGAAALARSPIQTIMSGPVAGVIGSRHLGDVKGIERLISFDTGGTSCDMAVIPGRPLVKSEVAVGRHPVRTRTVDIETLGAGGGSVASVQLGGVLKVGPQSAGADPGPACYGRGGGEATLTDALVVLGHLNPGHLLDGAMPISAETARAAVTRRIAEPLGMSAVEAARGILAVLSANVTAAMRTITVERGWDPREFTLIAFGGMGPTIAGPIARELGIGRIVVPRDPGAFSAYGMLVTDLRHERSVTRLTALDAASPAGLEALYRGIEEAVLADLARETIAPENAQAVRSAGMRYCGQSYEVAVAVGSLARAEDLADLARRFHEAHRRRYGHMAEGQPIEIVNFTVAGIGVIPKPAPKTFPPGSGRPPSPKAMRPAYFDARAPLEVPVYRRRGLAPGVILEGPAVVEEQTSTTVLHPGQQARVDEFLNLDVTLL
jgi:N-methylhydantoinase A